MMPVVYTDAAGRPRGTIDCYEMSLEYGDVGSDNEFKLWTAQEVKGVVRGSLLFIPGKAWGGIVHAAGEDATDGQLLTFRGPTWYGALANRCIRPPAGEDNLVLSGKASDVVARLLIGARFDDLYCVGYGDEFSVTWQFDRYCTLLEGIASIAEAYHKRMRLTRGLRGRTEISFADADDVANDGLGFKCPFAAETCTPVNHFIVRGKGEGREQEVIELFADARGNVSRTQSIFGALEIERAYDQFSLSGQELIDAGVKRLLEEQVLAYAELELTEAQSYELGQIVRFGSSRTGFQYTAPVKKVIIETNSLGETKVKNQLGDIVASPYMKGGSYAGN